MGALTKRPPVSPRRKGSDEVAEKEIDVTKEGAIKPGQIFPPYGLHLFADEGVCTNRTLPIDDQGSGQDICSLHRDRNRNGCVGATDGVLRPAADFGAGTNVHGVVRTLRMISVR